MNDYDNISPVILSEESFEGDYIIASYFYIAKPGEDIYEKAKSFAVGQTIGTWVPVPGITAEMKQRYGGKLVNIYDIPPVELTTDLPEETYHIIQIAFPDENFIPQIPMLMVTLLGNDVSTSAQVKLIDIKFSKNFLEAFNGPRFGINGIYEYMGLEHNRRPIVLNMIKPCLGYSAKDGADIFRQIALGGVDIIKDDELFADTNYSSIKERVRLYKKAAREVYEQTGHLTRYCVNITDRFDKTIEHAKVAVEEGADFLMVNFVATGISILQVLSEQAEIKIPVLAHYATAGSMTESPFTGISTPLLLGKLARLSGADLCMFSSPYSTYPFINRRYRQIADMQRLPFGKLKPVMPVIGGGVHPNSAQKIVRELGREVVLASGGAILGHPLGPTEGAKSMMQAAEALGKGISLEEAALKKENEALKISIKKWE